MDMGFEQLHAEEALLATGNNLAASMEWILTHPPSSSAADTRVCPLSFLIIFLFLFLPCLFFKMYKPVCSL